MLAIREYYRPERIEEALKLLNRGDLRSAILAGGTHLLSSDFNDVEAVIDLQDLGLDGIKVNESTIEIGAMVRLQTLIEHPDLPDLLARMALREGPNTFRNTGTIGGTIAVGNSNSELYAALLVYGARLTVQNEVGERKIPLAEVNEEGIGGGIITSIRVERFGLGDSERVARTPTDDPIVAVVGRRPEGGEVRLAFCGIGARPFIISVNEIAKISIPADFQGSSEYRRRMALILAERVQERLMAGK